MSETTEAKTMWSESLFETLYTAIERKKGKEIILDVVKDLNGKGYKNEVLVQKVQKRLGGKASSELHSMLCGDYAKSPAAKAIKRGRKAAKKTHSDDIGGKLEEWFEAVKTFINNLTRH